MHDLYNWAADNPVNACLIAASVVVGLLAIVNWENQDTLQKLAPVAWIVFFAVMILAVYQGGQA